MELRHIRYFLAVAEEGNFTRAAMRMGIGQPPLSQQIRDLEEEIGTRLFHRVPHGAELTEAGRAFLEGVSALPDQVAGAVRQAQRAGRGETGALRIGFTGAAALNPIVPAAIRAFQHSRPHVELTLSEHNSTALGQGVRDGSLDLAFLRPSPTEADLHLSLFPDEEMIAAVPLGHPALPEDPAAPLVLADLRDDPFILTPRPIGTAWFDAALEACELAGFAPQLGQAAPQLSSVLSLVAAGQGVSVVPVSMRQLALEGVSYRVIGDVKARTRLALASLRGRRNVLVQHFLGLALPG